jgi:hypothetical protein
MAESVPMAMPSTQVYAGIPGPGFWRIAFEYGRAQGGYANSIAIGIDVDGR